ncbi:DUF1801 domain-containing protein [Chloroflexota bacterium]
MDVDGYITTVGEPLATIVSKLRQIILMTAPGVYESIKWAQPVYESDGPFAYIRAYANHVDLGFWRGIDIRDPKDLLEGKGEKMRHIKFTNTADIDASAISEFVVQAIQLNRVLGNPTKGNSVE